MMPLNYKTQSHPRKVLVGATCDRCGADMVADEYEHLDGGIGVFVQGWYGATIDTEGFGEHIILCDTCARAFLSEWLPHLVEFTS